MFRLNHRSIKVTLFSEIHIKIISKISLTYHQIAFLFVVASSVSEGSFLCVSPVKWIYYAASFLISPSNTAVMKEPTAHARMYKSGCPTVANTKIPP